jgi:hypothetical protein
VAGVTKVFGIGLSRTGTLSLAIALQRLGLRTVHFPHDERTFAELTRGEYRLSVLDGPEGLDAIVDTPASAFFAELDAAFPGSRFVLTTRDREAWLRSCERLWQVTAEVQQRPFHRFINAATYGCWEFSAARFAHVHERHLADVREHFRDRPGQLLELGVCDGEGWERLCPFLGVPVPDRPFPRRDLLVPGGPG